MPVFLCLKGSYSNPRGYAFLPSNAINGVWGDRLEGPNYGALERIPHIAEDGKLQTVTNVWGIRRKIE